MLALPSGPGGIGVIGPGWVRRPKAESRSAVIPLVVSDGRPSEELVSLVEPGRPAVVIANAMDDEPREDRLAGGRRELAALEDLGIRARELDLRAYFGQSERLASPSNRAA